MDHLLTKPINCNELNQLLERIFTNGWLYDLFINNSNFCVLHNRKIVHTQTLPCTRRWCYTCPGIIKDS